MSTVQSKYEALQRRLEEIAQQDCALAFSGGTDSTLLCCMLKQAAAKQGTELLVLLAKTVLHPLPDLRDAREFCASHDLKLHEIELNELEVIEHNPKNRCYLCKRQIFMRLRQICKEHGVTQLIDGTNADDLKCYRPGLQAVKELHVLSPLAELGFTKAEVRACLALLGLKAAEKPSSACLATRFPYGTHLTPEKLAMAGKAEEALRALHFYNVRVRCYEPSLARIELNADELPRALELKQEIIQAVKKAGLHYVTLDLEGFRSGSMDEI